MSCNCGDYEIGHRDGESSGYHDWSWQIQEAIEEYVTEEFPVDFESPSDVAQWLRAELARNR